MADVESGGAKDVFLYLAGWAVLSLPGLLLTVWLVRRWWRRVAEPNRRVQCSLLDLLALSLLLAPGVGVAVAKNLFLGVLLSLYLALGGVLGWAYARYRAGDEPVSPWCSSGWMIGGILLLLLVGALAGGLLCGIFYLLHEGFFR